MNDDDIAVYMLNALCIGDETMEQLAARLDITAAALSRVIGLLRDRGLVHHEAGSMMRPYSSGSNRYPSSTKHHAPVHLGSGRMKLWIDDLREPPEDDWVWAETSKQAISVLMVWNQWLAHHGNLVTEISFDHDLGADDTTRPIVLWMCENGIWPKRINVHSANSVGAEWLLGTVDRYAPPEVVVTYQGIPRHRSGHH